MNNDWKDALSSLRNSLDPSPEENENLNLEKEEDEQKQKGPLHIVKDKKGRNGKIATIIEGFTIPREIVEDIARKLKQKLGVGGSVRDGEILIQGDHREAIKKFLESQNYKCRLS